MNMDKQREEVVPDKFCKQNKCARPTTGCIGYCKLDEINKGFIVTMVPKSELEAAQSAMQTKIDALEAERDELLTRNAELVDAADELRDIFQGLIEGEKFVYDSITLQPIERVLSANQSSADKWKREIEAKVLEEAMNNERITQTSKEELRRMAADRRTG
jgi:hypothetical protein